MLLDKLFNRAKPKEIADLEQAIERKSSLDKEVQDLNNRIKLLQDEIENKSKCLEEIKEELNIGENRIVAEDLGVHFEPVNKNINSIENDIYSVKTKIAKMLKDKSYCTLTRHYVVDSSERKGKELVEAFCENNILGFNLYCEKKRKAVTKENYQHTIDLIDKAFWRYSKRAKIVAAEFNKPYLDLNKKLCTLELSLKVKKQQDKDRIKEEKRKLREEQQLLAEAEKERKKLEEERKAMNIAFNKSLTESEREEIKQKLSEIDKRIADVDYRVNNPKAGWVYIIHSDSLPGLEKIGVSRRLSGPHERIRELSGSSLPTPFMIDAFCFSDDAFALESNLHKYFDKQRINPNKEFFRITAKEAINAMENVFGHKAHIINLEDNDNEID